MFKLSFVIKYNTLFTKAIFKVYLQNLINQFYSLILKRASFHKSIDSWQSDKLHTSNKFLTLLLYFLSYVSNRGEYRIHMCPGYIHILSRARWLLDIRAFLHSTNTGKTFCASVPRLEWWIRQSLCSDETNFPSAQTTMNK